MFSLTSLEFCLDNVLIVHNFSSIQKDVEDTHIMTN